MAGDHLDVPVLLIKCFIHSTLCSLALYRLSTVFSVVVAEEDPSHFSK